MRVRARTPSQATFKVLAAIVATLSLNTSHAQQPTRAALRRTVDSLAAAALAEGVVGLSVGVVRGKDTIVLKGYGFSDVENDVRATPQTVYRIGSITKQFTSAAVMQLVEQQKISLDDSIGKYLPTIPVSWRAAKIRQLLNHTSGIPSYTSAGAKWASKMRLDLSHDSLLAIIANDSLDFPMGSKWSYDNTGYYLLGMLLERVTGVPYPAFVQQHFFTPMGLSGTSYCDLAPIIRHRSQGYSVDKGKLENGAPLSMTQPFAAGSLCSTVGDLIAWQHSLIGGRVVSAASYAAMTTPEAAAVKAGYGFGLARDTLAGRTRIQHAGGINGFNTMLQYYPDERLSIVVLSNTNGDWDEAGPWAERIADNIGLAALGKPLLAKGKH